MVVHPLHVWKGIDNECNEHILFFQHLSYAISFVPMSQTGQHQLSEGKAEIWKVWGAPVQSWLAGGGIRCGISPWCLLLCARANISLFVRTAPLLFKSLGRPESPFQGLFLFYLIVKGQKANNSSPTHRKQKSSIIFFNFVLSLKSRFTFVGCLELMSWDTFMQLGKAGSWPGCPLCPLLHNFHSSLLCRVPKAAVLVQPRSPGEQRNQPSFPLSLPQALSPLEAFSVVLNPLQLLPKHASNPLSNPQENSAWSFCPSGLICIHLPACLFRSCALLGCVALSKPKLPVSSTCFFLALLSDLFLCHVSPNSTPTFGLVLIYTLKYPSLCFHVYIKAGGQGREICQMT